MDEVPRLSGTASEEILSDRVVLAGTIPPTSELRDTSPTAEEPGEEPCVDSARQSACVCCGAAFIFSEVLPLWSLLNTLCYTCLSGSHQDLRCRTAGLAIKLHHIPSIDQGSNPGSNPGSNLGPSHPSSRASERVSPEETTEPETPEVLHPGPISSSTEPGEHGEVAPVTHIRARTWLHPLYKTPRRLRFTTKAGRDRGRHLSIVGDNVVGDEG